MFTKSDSHSFQGPQTGGLWFSWVSVEMLMDQQALVPTGPTSAPAMAARWTASRPAHRGRSAHSVQRKDRTVDKEDSGQLIPLPPPNVWIWAYTAPMLWTEQVINGSKHSNSLPWIEALLLPSAAKSERRTTLDKNSTKPAPNKAVCSATQEEWEIELG